MSILSWPDRPALSVRSFVSEDVAKSWAYGLVALSSMA
jgi:hypothetical protein